MADIQRHGGPFGPARFPYTSPVPEGQEPRPSAFGPWDGYGGAMGFIDSQEPRTPDYQEAVDAVSDTLEPRDFTDKRFEQVIKDMGAAHGIPAENAWWDVMDDPEGHAKGWMELHGNPGQIPYNWAYSQAAPFSDGFNEQQRNYERVNGPRPYDSLVDGPIDPSDLHLYVGRVAVEHDMDMERQVSTAKARANEARRRGDAELADYIEGLIEVMQADAATGRPEAFKQTYWPMVQEEFGDERAGGPNGYITGAHPRAQEYKDSFLPRNWGSTPEVPEEPMYRLMPGYRPEVDDPTPPPYEPDRAFVYDSREVLPPDMPHDIAEQRFRDQLEFQRALPEYDDMSWGTDLDYADDLQDLQRPSRVAFQGSPGDAPVPEVDWGPMMDSVRETGGYTLDGPDSGYMISLPGTEERRPTESVSPQTEGDYLKRHWDKLLEDPDLSQGGWDSGGTFYTDLSRNDEDLYRTIGDAVSTDQLGIYDLNQGQTIDTYDNDDTDRDDYNPLMVSPSPVVMFGSHQGGMPHHPGKTTQERRDMWHNLGRNMLADVDVNGFGHTPGEQYMRDASGHNGSHVREGAHRLVAGGDLAFSQALAELRGVEQRQGAQRLHGSRLAGPATRQPGQEVPLRHAGQGLVQDRGVDAGSVCGAQTAGTTGTASGRRSAQRLPDQSLLGHAAGQRPGSGSQLDSRPVVGRDFLALLRQAGPLQPGTDDLAAYETEQFPTPPRSLAKPRKKPPTPEQRRMDRKKLRQKQRDQKVPKESLDPDMLDDRIDMDQLITNALSRYRGATPEQLEEGKKWYAIARARAEELARRTGGDFSKAAAIISAMSPQMEWDGNLNAAAHFLNTYDPTAKHDWRRPNLPPEGLKAWNDLTGGRRPETPEDFAEIAKLSGIDDQDWAKEMAMEGRWDRASGLANNPRYKHRGNYTGTGLPTLGENVLRAMSVYDADDPSELLDYAKGGPKIHSFWRNFLGDEDYVTIDKHMLRALERGFGEDPLLSYGDKTGDGKRKTTLSPEDQRVVELEGILGRTRTLKGDEQQTVPIGYNTYAEAIRRATQQANAERDPADQITPAQMQAIVWVQHKADMDAFRRRKSEEAWLQKNPDKPYKPQVNRYVPAVPTNGPAPDYYQSDEWAQENPYADGTPRPLVPEFNDVQMPPDNIPDPHLGPEDMSVMPAAPWADPAWSKGKPKKPAPQALPRAAGRWGRRLLALQRANPAELPYRTLLWMNQTMNERIRTPEDQAYADALDAEVRLRGEPYAVS